MRLLLDMNLSPEMARMIAVHGHDVVHWSQVGDHRATDLSILTWAREDERVLVTHDLDFAAILAETEDMGPSVIQIRAQDLLAKETVDAIVRAIMTAGPALESGAIVTVHEDLSRIRILPLRHRRSGEG